MTRHWAGVASLALGAGTAVATVLSQFERATWLFGLIDNFRFQFLWLGALALIGLAWSKRWIPFGLVALSVIVNLAAVGPYWWGSVARPVGPDRLSIVSLNTRAANEAKSEVVEFVRGTDADLVFLAEVTPQLLRLLEDAELEYQPVAGTPAVTPVGLLALSRDPSITGRVSNLGETGVPVLILEADLGDTPVEILALHTSSPGRLSEARDDQLQGAGRRVAQRETPMVLVGDFNATPYTSSFRDLLKTGLIDAQRGRGVAGSWPAGWGPFMIPIDHALHTPELTSASFEFGAAAGSDHRSVQVTLALADR